MTVPKNEAICLQALNVEGEVTHIITTDKHKDTYKLYEVSGDKLVYTKRKSDSPLELEKYIWG